MRLLFTLCLLIGTNLGANAAVIRVDLATGELLGATGVLIGDSLYDVEFRAGTCAAVFDGCDSSDDFDFELPDTRAASQALADQVFVDGPQGLFDSEPDDTFGCSGLSCAVITPGAVFPIDLMNLDRGNVVSFDVFLNRAEPFSFDIIQSFGAEVDMLSNGELFQSVVFADFSPAVVPTPALAPLLLAGLTGIGVMRRRKHKLQVAA